jgi:hypothetical protein
MMLSVGRAQEEESFDLSQFETVHSLLWSHVRRALQGTAQSTISERQPRKGRKGNEGRLRECEARTEAARGLVEINEYLMMESSGTGTGSCIKLSCQVVDIIEMGTFPAVAGAAPPAS